MPPGRRPLGVAQTVEGESAGIDAVEREAAGVACGGALGGVEDDPGVYLSQICGVVLRDVGVTVTHTGATSHGPLQIRWEIW